MTDAITRRDRRGAIGWMAGHSVAANLAMVMCVVGGFLAMRHMKQEVFPELAIDVVRVSVAYPGASPEEVERGIIMAVEEAVRGLDGAAEVSSTAGEGYGSVMVEMLVGGDLQKLSQDVQSEVDRITTFPDDAEEPQVSILTHKRQVLSVALYGHTEDTSLHELAEQVRDQLLQDPGIAQVELSGVAELEIAIEVSRENLRRYNLTLEEVASRLRNASVDVPGGGVKTVGGEILVRVRERRDYGRQFARLPIITTPDGGQVLLEQIATVNDGFEDSDHHATYNGAPAVRVDVFRVGDQTPTGVSAAVHRQVELLGPTLPAGIRADVLNDMSDVYRQRLELLLRNGAIGLVLVLIILGLFLEVRLAFWVMMGIPISFLGSFLILPSMDVTINMVSLFAYIVTLGIVVDDAIVVGENIYHHQQEGMSLLKSSILGAKEVAVPVTFSVLTNIATFMPLYFIPGVMGKVFGMIPMVVVTVFLISLFECLFILPAHLAHHRGGQRRGMSAWLHDKQQVFSHGFRKWVHGSYGPFLSMALRRRYLTITTAVTLLVVVSAYALSGRMGFELFPRVESDIAVATVSMPYGVPIEKTQAVVERIRAKARQVAAESGREDLIEGIFTEVGAGGTHNARVIVYMAEPEVRKEIMRTDEFTDHWREEVGKVAGAKSMRFESDIGGPGGGQSLTIELNHRDINVLARASAELATELRTYPSVKDVQDGFQGGKRQLDFTIKPEGKSLALTASQVSRQVRNAFHGAQVTRQQRGRNEIKIMVRLPKAQRRTEHSIDALMIRTPSGKDVPLREVARVKRGRAYTTIDRRGGRRVVQVSADVTPRSKTGDVLTNLRAAALGDLLDKHPGLRYSLEGHSADMRESLGSLKVTFIMAMLVVYTMLAIPFRSYVQPMIVMVSIPFGVVGAFLGHLVMGYDLCLPSVFGIVALSGVVINDSLIMIDFANRLRLDGGRTSHDVIRSAAIQRFRPILLTTVTTFGGLAPMMFETSMQARFLIPMALSLGFGLLFATAITLILVPCLYLVVEDVRALARAARD